MPISNRIEDLNSDLARVYTEAKASYIAAHPGGLRPRLGETARPAAVQTAYYAQGRQPMAEVNRLRQLAGLAAIGATDAATKVTQAKAGQSPHGFLPSRAFDVQMLKLNGEVDWSDASYIAFAAYVKVAAAKLNVSVSQGAYWPSFKDFPHTELAGWRTM